MKLPSLSARALLTGLGFSRAPVFLLVSARGKPQVIDLTSPRATTMPG
jgi:hypothetical protein